MTLTYIWHDCFWLSTKNANFIFDFWKDTITENNEFPRFIKEADKNKPLYVIVSHHHKDHFTKEIFEWSAMFRNIRFILSNDTAKFCRHILSDNSIYKGSKPSQESITVLKNGDTFKDDIMEIEAFPSTDIGNSYMIKSEGKTIFHSGDLNAWIWKDESTEQEVKKALGDFKAILRLISDKYPKIDIAMFPVDSRIGRDYFAGAKLFVRSIDVKHFFPMHFGLGETQAEQQKYQIDAADVKNYANPEKGEYICLQAPYSSFSFPD